MYKTKQYYMYPTVFDSLGYKKPPSLDTEYDDQPLRRSTRSRKTKQPSPKKSTRKTRNSSPKTRSASPKTIPVTLMNGTVVNVSSALKNISAVKHRIQDLHGIPVAEQEIYEEDKPNPLSNRKGKLCKLQPLFMINKVPVPPEFRNLENITTLNLNTNISRVIISILLSHKEGRVTYPQLIQIILTNDDFRRPFSGFNCGMGLFIINLGGFLKDFYSKGIITFGPIILPLDFVDNHLVEDLSPTEISELIISSIGISDCRFASTFFGIHGIPLNFLISLNRDHPYIATLF